MSIKNMGLSRLEENRRKAEAEKPEPVKKKAAQPIRPEPTVIRTGIGWVLDRDGFPAGGSMPSQDYGPGRWPDDVTPRYKR